MLSLVLLVFAFVLTLICALMQPQPAGTWRVPHLGWLGLAVYFASLLFAAAGLR